MRILAHLLYPGEHNNYHPHVTRPPFLLFATIVLFLLTIFTNVFYSTRPKILGFATSIYVEEIINLTNKEREKLGVGQLAENPILNNIAQEKAEDMFAKNYWSHTSPDGIMPWYFFQKWEYNYLYAGENLARDFYTSGAIVAAWSASPSHRDNLLSKNYKEIGVAVVNGLLDNRETTLVVQVFGTPLSSVDYLGKNTESSEESNFSVGGGSPQVVKILPLATLGLTQKIYLGFSLILLSFFLLDSYILIKRRINHKERHPFFHIAMLSVIVFFIIYLNKGMII